MTDFESVPEFGERGTGEHYVQRPGSYGLAFDGTGHVCLIRTHTGYFIPGGGADAGETEVETLTREFREECGRGVGIIRRIGAAVQYVFAAGEGYFAKECAFYEVSLRGEVVGPSEDDHVLVWVSVDEAFERISHGSQRWALEMALRGR